MVWTISYYQLKKSLMQQDFARWGNAGHPFLLTTPTYDSDQISYFKYLFEWIYYILTDNVRLELLYYILEWMFNVKKHLLFTVFENSEFIRAHLVTCVCLFSCRLNQEYVIAINDLIDNNYLSLASLRM